MNEDLEKAILSHRPVPTHYMICLALPNSVEISGGKSLEEYNENKLCIAELFLSIEIVHYK